MKGDPAAELNFLLPYHRGAYFATVAISDRLSTLSPECEEAVLEVARYQSMVKRYFEAFQETTRMHGKRHSGR